MAIKLTFQKIKVEKNLLSRLPRFNIDLRFNNSKIDILYTPMIETLVRVWKEKKGIVAIANKQFTDFESKSKPTKINVKLKKSVK